MNTVEDVLADLESLGLQGIANKFISMGIKQPKIFTGICVHTCPVALYLNQVATPVKGTWFSGLEDCYVVSQEDWNAEMIGDKIYRLPPLVRQFIRSHDAKTWSELYE